jgi:hypothetical protein
LIDDPPLVTDDAADVQAEEQAKTVDELYSSILRGLHRGPKSFRR